MRERSEVHDRRRTRGELRRRNAMQRQRARSVSHGGERRQEGGANEAARAGNGDCQAGGFIHTRRFTYSV